MIETNGTCSNVSQYTKHYTIGQGTYGRVYLASRRDRPRDLVALKRIILHNEKDDGFPITSLRELNCLKRCSGHPNVVALLDVVVGNNNGVFLVFEYAEHDLAQILDASSSSSSSSFSGRSPFSESEVKCLVYQLLSGVAHLHSLWLMHRDLKLQNLLYTNAGQLKIADFGLARACGRRDRDPSALTQKVVTLWYRAPELLLGAEAYSNAIDVWSCGCVLAELLLGRPLMPGRDEADQLSLVFALLGAPTQRIWPDISNMPLVRSGAVNLYREQQRHPYNDLEAIFPRHAKFAGSSFSSSSSSSSSAASPLLDLLNGLLCLAPERRLACSVALRHGYFYTSPHPKEVALMPSFPLPRQLQDKINSIKKA